MPKVSFAGSPVVLNLAHVTYNLVQRYLAITFGQKRIIVTPKTLCDVHWFFQPVHPFIKVGPGVIQRDSDDVKRTADQDGRRIEEHPNAFS